MEPVYIPIVVALIGGPVMWLSRGSKNTKEKCIIINTESDWGGLSEDGPPHILRLEWNHD